MSTKLKPVKTWKDFQVDVVASNRNLVAEWMKLEAYSLRTKAKNVRTRYEKAGAMNCYVERYAKLVSDLADVFEEDSRRLLGNDFSE